MENGFRLAFLRNLIGRAWLPVLFLLATIAPVKAGDYTCTTNSDDTITITGYTGPGGAVVIPSAIGGKTVTRIEVGAFRYSTSLTSLTIGNCVTSIGSDAFYSCTRLTSVTIPDSVTSIGEAVFERCTSLANVTIGNGVTSGNDVISIKDGAFSFCTNLTGVYFKGNAPSIGLGVFDDDDNATVYCLEGTTGWRPTFGGRLTAVWKPQVPNDANFDGRNSRTASSAPRAVDALSGNPVPVLFPLSTVTAVNADDFTYATNSDDTVSITKYNGSGNAVVIPSAIGGKTVTSIGFGAFAGYTRLTSVTIGNGITNIGVRAFDSCTSLASLTIPYGVTTIGDYAFASCTSLTSVTIPGSVTSLGNFAFYNCTRLTSVTIGKSVANIGVRAFEDCTRLTGIYFKGNAPRLGSSVFDGDTNATVRHLKGTTGWGKTFGDRPTAVWKP